MGFITTLVDDTTVIYPCSHTAEVHFKKGINPGLRSLKGEKSVKAAIVAYLAEFYGCPPDKKGNYPDFEAKHGCKGKIHIADGNTIVLYIADLDDVGIHADSPADIDNQLRHWVINVFSGATTSSQKICAHGQIIGTAVRTERGTFCTLPNPHTPHYH